MGAELEVDLLVCSVGFRLVRRKNALDEEENGTKVYTAPRGAEKHTSRCARTHTCVTRMLGLHPSHESKLFETRRKRYGTERAKTRPKGKQGNVKGTGGRKRKRQ